VDRFAGFKEERERRLEIQQVAKTGQLTLNWTPLNHPLAMMESLSAILGSLEGLQRSEEAEAARRSIPDVGRPKPGRTDSNAAGVRELSSHGQVLLHAPSSHHATKVNAATPHSAPRNNNNNCDMSISHSLVWKRPVQQPEPDDGEFRRKKLKLNDLPITNAKKTAIDGLLLTFKKSGEFDKMRKGIFAQFESSVGLVPLRRLYGTLLMCLMCAGCKVQDAHIHRGADGEGD
jgi:hypothetical protein